MKKLTDASHRLNDFVDLLRTGGGLDIHAHIRHIESTGTSGRPELIVELSGPDSSLLIGRDGELLDAIEHVAAELLRLHPAERHRLAFDAADFKADRERALHRLASDAVVKVRTTCVAYTFLP